ncbi:MAG: tetratricopeptide repeat protein [Candidatus Peribacteraceae bacterium]|nr:tetratricopeptide repeat protein [Candidatus Peribacteraceae bacterium]
MGLSKKKIAVLIASFFALTFFTYGSSIKNEFVNYDDDTLIYLNPAVQEFSPESIAWVFTHLDPELYIPVTFLSYQLDHIIGGLNPSVFHTTSIILHTLNALFVVWLIFLLSKKSWLALFCGLLFAVHPLHTETVMWASARKEVLSTFFFLSALIAYIYHQDIKNNKWYFLSLGLFLFGILSKVSIVILPIILLLIDFKKNRKINLQSFITKIPYFVISIIFGVVALLGKQSVLSSSSYLDSVLMAFKSTAFYLQKLFIPTNLSVIYPYNEQISITSPDFLLPIITIIALIVLVILSVKKTKEVLFGSLLFFIALIPSFTNYARAGDIFYASDHYAYLPSIGILYIVGIAFMFLLNRYRKVALSSLFVILITFSILSSSQAKIWENNSTLFGNVIYQFNDSYLAHNKIGLDFYDENNLSKAINSFNSSIEIKPNASAYYNLGVAYIALQQYSSALDAITKSVELDPSKMMAQYNLGYLYSNIGQNRKAIERFLIVVENNPKDIDALKNLAVLNIKIGDTEKAKIYINNILEIDPENGDVKILLQKI